MDSLYTRKDYPMSEEWRDNFISHKVIIFVISIKSDCMVSMFTVSNYLFLIVVFTLFTPTHAKVIHRNSACAVCDTVLVFYNVYSRV